MLVSKSVRRLARSLYSISARDFRAAVVLAGSGVYDGSEITETTSLLISLSKHQAEV